MDLCLTFLFITGLTTFLNFVAQLNAPSDRLFFAPGDDARIVWKYSGDINQIVVRAVAFTKTDTCAFKDLIEIEKGRILERNSNGLDFQFLLPLTLILKNVTHKYTGRYTMDVLINGSYGYLTSSVHVFIGGLCE